MRDDDSTLNVFSVLKPVAGYRLSHHVGRANHVAHMSGMANWWPQIMMEIGQNRAACMGYQLDTSVKYCPMLGAECEVLSTRCLRAP